MIVLIDTGVYASMCGQKMSTIGRVGRVSSMDLNYGFGYEASVVLVGTGVYVEVGAVVAVAVDTVVDVAVAVAVASVVAVEVAVVVGVEVEASSETTIRT